MHVIGYSVAGEETVVQIPEMNVCFDIGRAQADEFSYHSHQKALARAGGNARQAAEALGLSRSAFYRRLQQYGL